MIRFVYRDILKIDINQDSLELALKELENRDIIFDIHPLSFDYWIYIDVNDYNDDDDDDYFFNWW